MSRQIFLSHRYLFILSVSAILVCGSSRRIPRGASCPSCSLDCPEALTVQLPRSDQESNLKLRVLRNFSINSPRNSLYSSLIEEEIPQGIRHNNNILPSQNSVFPVRHSLGNYKSFFPQKLANGNLFKNFFNKFPKFVDRQETFSQNKSASRYPLARVLPSKEIFNSENILKNPSSNYFSSSLEDRNFKNNIKDKKDIANKMLVALNSRDTSLNILPQRFSPKIDSIFNRDPVLRSFDEKGIGIRKSPNFINQQYSSTYPRKEYNSAINVWEPTKNNEFFDNWDDMKYSSRALNLEQQKQAKNNFLDMYPAEEQEIITEDNNEQIIDKSYMHPRHLDARELSDNGKSFDDWNSDIDEQKSAKINRLQKARNNWLQLFPAIENNIKFENEKGKDENFVEQENINQDNEDELVQDTMEIEQSIYDPYAFSQNMNNWETVQDKEFFGNVDLTREHSQKTNQLQMYTEKNNDKFFQNEANEDISLESKAQISDRIDRTPMINAYNAYILPRYLNVLNDAKYSTDSSEIQEIPEAKNNILHANSMRENNERFFVNEDIQNDAPIQDVILYNKDIFDMNNEYSSRIEDKNSIRDNTQVSSKLDLDLLNDFEDLPLESTESTLIESLTKVSTTKQ